MSQDHNNGSKQQLSGKKAAEDVRVEHVPREGVSLDQGQNASVTAVSGPEALSALMDGELSAFEYRRLINELDHHPDWLDQWERFHLIRDGLRAEPWAEPLPASLSSHGLSLSERIAAEVAKETPVSETAPLVETVASRHWWQMGGRVAVAAAVALAVFAGMQNMLSIDGANTTTPMTALQNPEVDASTGGAVSSAQLNQNIADASSIVDQDAQQRLNDYIRSVSIPSRSTEQSTPFNILRESPLLRPVSDRELLPVQQLPDNSSE